MGRSIHTTWRDYRRELRRGGDPAARRERLAEMRQQLATKRRIKDQVKAGRRRELDPVQRAPVSAAGVPIRVVDDGPHLLHPAGVADLRAVIERLPPGALTGVSEVALAWGAGFQDEGDERDPHTGRVGVELLPGVWSGRVLGVYQYAATRISVFAYVVADELFEPEFTALFLKLRALVTFVHEVAHHQDHMLRVARGRWRADSTTHRERYAEALEHDWTRSVVVPYLEQAYPEACAALRAWVRAQVGIDVTLVELAGDCRTTGKRGLTLISFPVSSAFCALLEGLAAGKDAHAVRLDFARELHYGDHFALALQIVEGVLAEAPTSQPARVLRADLLEHLERYDEAEALLRALLAEDAACAEAWYVLGLVHWHREEWEGVRVAAEARLGLLEPGHWERGLAQVDLCRALFQLGDDAALHDALAELLGGTNRFRRAQAQGFHALSLVRQGRLDEALEASEAGLAEVEALGTPWEHELRLARALALQRLGRPAEPLGARSRESLERRGFGAWLGQLDD